MATKPFANSTQHNQSLTSSYILAIQIGNATDDNGLNQMRYITLGKLQEYMRGTALGALTFRGAYSSALPDNAAVNDYFFASATFTVDEVTYTENHMYAYNSDNEWNDITNIMAYYVRTSDIVDNLTTEETTKPLSAKQGVVIQSSLNGKVNTSEIVDNLASQGASVPLSANQGRVLKLAVDTKVNTADIVNNVVSADTDKPLSANMGKKLYVSVLR